jgi:hypothetical protein
MLRRAFDSRASGSKPTRATRRSCCWPQLHALLANARRLADAWAGGLGCIGLRISSSLEAGHQESVPITAKHLPSAKLDSLPVGSVKMHSYDSTHNLAIASRKGPDMRHSLLVLSLIIVSLLTGHSVLLTSATLQQQPKTTPQDRPDRIHAEHSKLYKQYPGRGDLWRLAEKTSGDVEVVTEIPQKMFQSDAPPIQLGDILRELTNKSDAVLIGVVKDRASFVTAEGTFVFTDYGLAVEQILKNNPASLLHPFDKVSVTRPGGEIQLNGHSVRAVDQSLAPLAVGGRYLLFLDYVPITGSYKAFNSQGSFRVQGSKTTKLTKEQLPSDLESGADVEVLAAFIRAAVR